MQTLMNPTASGDDDASTAIQKYATFVETVLKPQLQASLSQRDALTTEIREYEELLAFIHEQLRSEKPLPLATLMDLGQRFHVRAKIPDTTMITVDIGLNFHAEMTMAEADAFVAKHLQHLDEYVCSQLLILLRPTHGVWKLHPNSETGVGMGVCVAQQEAAAVAAKGARDLDPRGRGGGGDPEIGRAAAAAATAIET